MLRSLLLVRFSRYDCRRLFLFLTIGAILASGVEAGDVAPAPPIPEKGRLIAHRGESIEAPENTLEAFKRAFAADQSLDHVLANGGIEFIRQRIVRHPAAMDVSDHSPVVVDFRLNVIR